MSAKRNDNSRDPGQELWLRLVCDDGLARGAAQSSLPAEDGAVDREMAECRALVDELRTVLEPRALSEAAIGRICARLEAAPTRSPIARLAPAVWACPVAAAAAVALMIWGPGSAPSVRLEAPAIAISAEDVAEIVSAVGLLDWGGHVDYMIDSVSSEVEAMEQNLGQLSGSPTGLPWKSEDNWDSPPGQGSGAPRGTLL